MDYLSVGHFVMYTFNTACVVAADPVPGADQIDVASHQEVGVVHGTETAAGVDLTIVTAATARRVALVARATTKVAHEVATEAAPAASMKPETSKQNPRMAWITNRTTAKHPSLHGRQMMRTTSQDEKAVRRPRPVVDQKKVPRVHLPNRLAVVAAVAVAAEHQTRTTEVGCSSCGVVTFAVFSPQWTSP